MKEERQNDYQNAYQRKGTMVELDHNNPVYWLAVAIFCCGMPNCTIKNDNALCKFQMLHDATDFNKEHIPYLQTVDDKCPGVVNG